ncbi:Cloroperoxidase [Aspergillus campestris IBT 28561]|uniref:Cloroperoxidase n=1 Tax=Aspergillus campestris (strain IBT 28561) TaxID=1392248 RepID=A0A2I1DFM7_ASPC2|nr:Cloroperoxidase [Aspergillus campestris IBT 28561]PKY08683.1 Cloroperoxidase [Aspergillus campestris IBT 28561]
MKLAILSTALSFVLATANPHYAHGSASKWEAPGLNDFRGPCPMLNTLANHHFLPHDGKGITKDVLTRGLGDGLNFNASLAGLMFKMATVANPEPNATFFTLDHLNRHNVLEHDASLSRTDAYFGNNHVFNETIFNETRAYWTAPLLDAKMLANGKIARQVSSRAYNPTYKFTSNTEAFSVGEVSAPIVAFGDMDAATVKRDLVEYFFENERFPTELGWSRKEEVVNIEDITRLSAIITNATNLLTGSQEKETRRKDLHSGFQVL